MEDKKRIKNQLLAFTGGGMFINLSDLQKFLSAGKEYTRRIVAGLSYWENGKEKRYFVDDVVQRLWDERITA
jgi:hypothetical protein